jgi:hypothetical protein
MILRLTVILMLFSMLSHTLLGCGWHHAHEAHAGHGGSCQPVAKCGHGAEHAHDHHSDHDHADHAHLGEHPEEPPATPEHSDPCQEGRCSYLAAASVKVHDESSQLISLLPVWDLLSSTQDRQYVNQMRELIPVFLFSSPGVRAQAQTTVWLI